MRRSTKQQLYVLLFLAALIYGIHRLTAAPAEDPVERGRGRFAGGGATDPATALGWGQPSAADETDEAAVAVAVPPRAGGSADLGRRAAAPEAPAAPAAAAARPPVSPNPLAAAYRAKVPAPPDVRHPECAAHLEAIKQSGRRLPTTSVIFCFCNEPSASLFHSIHSVIDRARGGQPGSLLHEIILVDDGSTAEHIGRSLEEYVATLPVPVKIVRQHARTGLMVARVAGARAATGDTLTFLDSHIDCSEGWLEFLMARIGPGRVRWGPRGLAGPAGRLTAGPASLARAPGIHSGGPQARGHADYRQPLAPVCLLGRRH